MRTIRTKLALLAAMLAIAGVARAQTLPPPPLHDVLYRIGGDSTGTLTIARADDGRAWLEVKGEWSGAGVFTDSSYYGVFMYDMTARDAQQRRARGTHEGRVDPDGTVHVRGTWANRPWPAFETTWSSRPEGEPPLLRNLPHSISPEELREIPVDDFRSYLDHPVWPPSLPPPAGAADRARGMLHFRGGRPFHKLAFSGPMGVDSASGSQLGFTLAEHRLTIELPGEWMSAGPCTDTSYTGRFIYRSDASDPRLRGAEGAHTGFIDSTGTVHVHVTFDDRSLAPFDMTWVPSMRLDSIPVTELTPEDIRAMRAREMVHPVWPPPKSNWIWK